MDGKCLEQCIVYKATVTSGEVKRVYYGSCEGTFKERFGNHKKSFKHEEYKEETKLSQYVWELRNSNQQYEIAWSIEKSANPTNQQHENVTSV